VRLLILLAVAAARRYELSYAAVALARALSPGLSARYTSRVLPQCGQQAGRLLALAHVDDYAAAVDFAHLKRQLPMARVLGQLGLTPKLKGAGPQRRCACPIHRGDQRGRTFSVHLDHNVFHCHDPRCGKQGDVLDLWASVKGMSLRAAALDLVETFNLEPAPAVGTEKRNG